MGETRRENSLNGSPSDSVCCDGKRTMIEMRDILSQNQAPGELADVRLTPTAQMPERTNTNH